MESEYPEYPQCPHCFDSHHPDCDCRRGQAVATAAHDNLDAEVLGDEQFCPFCQKIHVIVPGQECMTSPAKAAKTAVPTDFVITDFDRALFPGIDMRFAG